MRKVHENIEIIRAAKGITKRALAQSVGVTEITCCRMLWGDSKIPADYIPAFAKALGIEDLNVLFKDELTDLVSR